MPKRHSLRGVQGLLSLRLLVFGLALPGLASASGFGLSKDRDYYTVDTGGGLVFKVRRSDPPANTLSTGDLASLIYRGVEYQDPSHGSQLNSGANALYTGDSKVTVDAEQIASRYIKITVVAGPLIHYYIVRRGEPRIYMATVFDSEPSLGLLRYIVRVPYAKLPRGPSAADISAQTRTVEARDVFAMANGQTRSKHYSNSRLKDWHYIGATGNRVGLWIVRDNGEGMSGGPFYRSLLDQGASDQEITYVINYGMAQTEAFRSGTLNVYTLLFSDGSKPPESIDTAWMSALGLKGYVAARERGAVRGVIGGQFAPGNFRYTAGFSNETAQYWADVDAGDGHFSATGLRPGKYTMRVYKNELAVATASVTVSAGERTDIGRLNVTDDPSSLRALWRIGEWDGTPVELRNGRQVTFMHPSDPRLSSWNPGEYVVGRTNAASGFPAYQWKDVNGTLKVRFKLNRSQIAASQVRIGVTIAYLSARPRISVNAWTSGYAPPPDQPRTRSLTVGTYRGNNMIYTFNVPASALLVGENELQLSVISGKSGSGYLSPGVAYDALDFVQ